MEEENNILYLFVFFSVNIYYLACYLYVGETFSTIFNHIHPFEKRDTNNIA